MLSFYRTKSALQIKIIYPKITEKGYIEKEGAVLFEFAKGENNKYDWKNKLSFGLGINDFPIILTALEGIKVKNTLPKNDKQEEKIDIIHKYNDNTKTLVLKKAPQSGYFLTLFQGKDYISVSMNYGDLLLLYYFLVNQGFKIIDAK